VAQVVSRAADEAFTAHAQALERLDWHAALEQLSTNLIWRSVALALRLQLTSPVALKAGGAIAIAAEVGRDCFDTMSRSGVSDEPDSPYRKSGYIQDVLLGVANTIAALEAQSPPQKLQIVTLSALALGRHEATLAMAEAGHWDTIAAERRRRSNAGKKTAQLSRETIRTGWMAAAMEFIRKRSNEHRTREGWATLIAAEVPNAPKSITQIALWLKTEAEAPHGPLPNRSRKRRA